MKTQVTKLCILLLLLGSSSCRQYFDYFDETEPRPLVIKDFASGFINPIGLVVDTKGQVWVSQAGSGKDDSRISVITPDGKVYQAIEGFRSVNFDDGSQGDGNVGLEGPNGVSHILLKEDTLWILHSVEGKLYWADVTGFRPGDTPLQAASLPSEDIGTFVRNHSFEEDTEQTNLYNLIFGPDGALYIVDAAANAVIRRDASGALSVFATIPGIKNPTSVGPPTVQSVPTSIAFDGRKFYVTAFLGFPFPAEKGRLYEIDLKGHVSVYQEGFSGLVDVELGPDKRPLLLEFGQFNQQGPVPNTGRIVRGIGSQKTIHAEGLNMPTDVVRAGLKTYYITSLAEGRVQKVTYP